MAKLGWLLLCVLVTAQLCDGYKILLWFTVPGKSHNILGTGFVKNLLEAGHEVTHLTLFPTNKPTPGLQEIDISEKHDEYADNMLNITALLENNVATDPRDLFRFVGNLVEKPIQNPNVVKLLSDTSQNFDVVIAEWMFTDINAALGAVYECPLIWLSAFEPYWMILRLIDEHTNPSYVPDGFSSSVPPFSFQDRLQALSLHVLGIALRVLYVNSYEDQMYEKLYAPYIKQRGRPVPPFDEVRYNGSLMLGNSHVSLGLPTRLPQAYKPIGGYHIDTEVKPLPDDLKKLLDNSKDGLIYFSMGSNLKSKDIPDSLKKGLIKMFSGLKQTILWKFEEKLPDLPSNVHIINWAPQQSILDHPNCILFITHGGMLSTTEAIHFGKPIIGIPVYGDQFNNIDRAVSKGFALRVDLSYSMVEHLQEAINEVLRNPSLTKTAKELSFVYHDRPVTPAKELVHWVEHVVKTRGAPHLRSPALHVPVYQKMYLDLLAIILVLLYVTKKIITRLCYSKKWITSKKKTN